MPPDTDQLQFIRAVRGAPATILLLLLIRGSSMTNLEICHWTGFTDKPVSAALAVLQHLNILQYNGRQHGWSLRSGVQNLLPFIHQLNEPVDKEIGIFPISPTTTSSTTTVGREVAVVAADSGAAFVDRKYSDLEDPVDRKYSDLDRSTHELDRRISDLLVEGGIGRNSKKFRELLAANLDPHIVEAHVQERLETDMPVGLLIKKLLDGDPPPRPRHRAGRQTIPAEYADVIYR